MAAFFKLNRKEKILSAKEYELNNESLGNIIVRISPKAIRISLVVKKDGTVKLTLPIGIDLQYGINFAVSRKEWIDAAKIKIAARVAKNKLVIEDGFRTRLYTFRFIEGSSDKIKIKLSDYTIYIIHGKNKDEIQKYAKAALRKILRLEALAILPERVDIIAKRFGFSYGKISIRDSKTRWGSCSSNNDISLSIHLMRLPDHLINFIITHELCHTIHKNHGDKCHELLNKLTNGREKYLLQEEY